MNCNDYQNEVDRQLNNGKYYNKLDHDITETVKQNICNCIHELSKSEDCIEDEFDTFPTKTRTPQFYILPKIHKPHDNTLPLGYPGRPIVSACNSQTDNISKFLDYVLKPHMQSLPSYIKDTTDFLTKIKSCNLSSHSYLVTLDVNSLYTNIRHSDGIEACRFFLNANKDLSDTKLSVDSICALIELTLKNNHFQFNGHNYIQIMGTAMGAAMAPAYASLFMGKFEQDFIETCQYKPTLWLRFLDDIFMLWDHSLEQLESFVKALNEFHESINFTYDISREHVSFLDVDIYRDSMNKICTKVHIKNTNVHQYLEYSSCHPKTCKDGIPLSQAKRYRRIISDDQKFSESLDSLWEFFKVRNYPEDIINRAFYKARNMTQEQALVYNETRSNATVVPFVIEYNPSLPNIGNILHKYWDLFKLSPNPATQNLHSYKPVLAYKRGKNLRDFLVNTKYVSDSSAGARSSKCSRPRCSHCINIIETDSYVSSSNMSRFKLKENTNCSSTHVIYLITCQKCGMQYVGQTRQQVSKRMNSHRFDINNFTDPLYATNVAAHFNSADHSLEDFRFLPIEVLYDDMDRLTRETYWMHKLNTVHPSGLNSDFLFNV